MLPMAAGRSSLNSSRRYWRASSEPTRSSSIRISGCTRRSPPESLLLRDFEALGRSFHSDASYIWLDEAARHGIDFAMHGPEFSRGFAALKVCISLLAHGRAAYDRRIAHDAALAGYLGELVEAHPDFELMSPPRLSVCCFRYRPAGWNSDEETLDHSTSG
jgi:glutamate/tyrosine decarboxylase-like PLP-dependent enzyme